MAHVTMIDGIQTSHGKMNKADNYYYRYHYGKERKVKIHKEYVDRPTENQKKSRKDFTLRRQEVSRQLCEQEIRAKWEERFAKQSRYKLLHTYVYAMLTQEEKLQ